MTSKDIAVAISLIAIALYAISKELQIVAIASMTGTLGLIYKWRARQFIEEAMDLFKKATRAKVGEVEIQIGNSEEDITPLLEGQETWGRSVLSGLGPEHIGLLITISHAAKYQPRESMKHHLRALRARGLLHHNENSMAESNEVWLSNTGNKLVKFLLATPNLSVTGNSESENLSNAG